MANSSPLINNREKLNKFDEVLSVAVGQTLEIVTYTVPADKKLFLVGATANGTNIGRYFFKVNGQAIDKKQTWYNGGHVAEFFFNRKEYPGGTIVSIDVENRVEGVSDFYAVINGELEDA